MEIEGGDGRLTEALEKVRAGDIFIDPGYDGVYGEVHIWGKESQKTKSNFTRKPTKTILKTEPENTSKDQLKLFE